MNKFVFFVFLFLSALQLSFTADILNGHRGNVTSITHNGDNIISAGEDGFIVIWDIKEKSSIVRFQLTTYSIIAMVKHPQKEEICIIESGGIDDYRISVWNYTYKKKLFSKQSSEPLTYVNYSSGGGYLIAAGLNGSLVLLNSGTGEIISVPTIPAGTVSFAMTGKSERNILLYQPNHDYYPENDSGLILYFDMAASSVVRSFKTQGDLSNPVIFGNGRFLAGLQGGTITVIDVTEGNLLDVYEDIERNALLCPAGDGFYCLTQKGGPLLLKFTIDRHGNLNLQQKFSLSHELGTVSAIAYNGNLTFAAADGKLFIHDSKNNIYQMKHNFQARITEIAAGHPVIAVLTEKNELFFIPEDYRLLEDKKALTFELRNGYTKISAIPASSSDKGIIRRFILWQNVNTIFAPQIVYSNHDVEEYSLNFIFSRFPVRSIVCKHDKFLVLDAGGRASVFNLLNLSTKANFTFSSVGAIDAAFIDNENFILCRSVISGSSPFLIVNSKTGETVPVFYPAQAGVMVYIGVSGNIYACAVEQDIDNYKTAVIKILLPAARTEKLFDFIGEDTQICAAESSFSFAASGGEGAAIYGDRKILFERTDGLPVKLTGCEEFFIVLDSEGNIAWHNNKTGKLLAVFKLYEDLWILKTGTEEISGSLLKH
jgi:WD40 repeat protein